MRVKSAGGRSPSLVSKWSLVSGRLQGAAGLPPARGQHTGQGRVGLQTRVCALRQPAKREVRCSYHTRPPLGTAGATRKPSVYIVLPPHTVLLLRGFWVGEGSYC